jgi:hypothetical protein
LGDPCLANFIKSKDGSPKAGFVVALHEYAGIGFAVLVIYEPRSNFGYRN